MSNILSPSPPTACARLMVAAVLSLFILSYLLAGAPSPRPAMFKIGASLLALTSALAFVGALVGEKPTSCEDQDADRG